VNIGKYLLKTLAAAILCGIAVLMSGCGAGISRTGYQLPANTDSKKLEKCPIAIKSNAQYDSKDVELLGSIHSYDNGFSTDCDEAYCLDIFCREGCLLSADVINITEEKQPDLWSTCYRARADFLRFKNRDMAKSLYSDPHYAPELIIARSVKTGKRTKGAITGAVLAGPLAGIVIWEATK
jgi:hypothetical protein